MTQKIQALRGMHDLLPTAMPLWQTVERVLRELLTNYGYHEIRTPLLESTALFCRSIGEVTDIVEKEMYTFLDRNEVSLTLRPEATAGIVRAGIEQGLFYNQTQKLWHIGPMFRYEKPQKGRCRQFHQADVEVFGLEGPDVDAEIIALCARLWQRLGLSEVIKLELNSMGTPASRALYREKLIQYFESHHALLDEDSLRRLHTNPLRILDSKNPVMAEMLNQAPQLIDSLDDASAAHFKGVCARLDALSIAYTINPRIVRGMDYYSRTVFEWTTTQLGAQGTVCGGGRYDGMVEQLGGQATPAVGFAIGMERLVLLCETMALVADKNTPTAYLIMVGDAAQIVGLQLAEQWRNALPQLRLTLNAGGGQLKNQLKRADKSGADYALIIGDDEIAQRHITIKSLRDHDPQLTLAQTDIESWLRSHC